MTAVAVTNTFVDGNTILAAGHNTNFSDLVTYINNRNSASATWDALSVLTASAVPGIFNNSSGTSNILEAKDNGTTVFLVADGGKVGIGAATPDGDIEIEGGECDIHLDSSGNAYMYFDRGTTSTEAMAVFQTAGVTKCAIGLDNDTTDVLYFCTGGDLGTPKMSLDANGTLVLNEVGSANADCRIESDADANCFFLDSSANKLFLGGTAAGTGTFTYTSGGGIQMGAPTGGDKGSGTANFAADIYKNNTAYTSPDYVLEHWATGKIDKFTQNEGAKEYLGLMPLSQIEKLSKENFCLPLLHEARKRTEPTGGLGVFSGGDAVLASLEEAYIHLFDINRRLSKLENPS